MSFRDPSGDVGAFDEAIKDVAKTFQSFTDARVLRGQFLNIAGYPSTLPIGIDRLRASRLYAHRNIAQRITATLCLSDG